MDRSITATGIGLRHCHLAEIFETKPKAAWFEILADNHMEGGGAGPQLLTAIRSEYPMTFHCVNMSLGSTDPMNREYLKRLKSMIAHYEPALVSDHVCFTHVDQRYYHELLPLPYTEEALTHLANRIQQVQDFLGQRILVENVSSYFTYQHSTLDEWEFITALIQQADCELLLDVNNIYINSVNHAFDPDIYLGAIPFDRVREIHLAGFDDRGSYLLDAHNNPVTDDVWQIFHNVMHRAPHIPALIEWDNDIPELSVLLAEADKAEAIRHAVYTTAQQETA